MKTAILITARLKSTRLPLKAIKPIHGRPMFCHLLDRLKLARRPQQIIVCTSPLEQDDPLVDLARQEGVEHFRGDPEDVLLRLTSAAAAFGVDLVVNCMADNPFTDPEYLDRLVDFHLANQHDYSKTEGLPLGCFGYTLSYPALVKACEIKAASDTEIWGSYFTHTGLFRWGTMRVTEPEAAWPELRLTVDTPADFEVVTRIFDALHRPGQVFPLRDIIALCRRQPELAAINAAVVQRPAPPVQLKQPAQ